MDVILWRHAEAEEFCLGGDLARRLTAKGIAQAERVGQWLDARLPGDASVVSSPALRARETADALGRRYEILPAVGPDASARQILNALGWPKGHGTTLLIGHQPALGQTAALLLCGEARDWQIRKSAAWWLEGGSGDVALRYVVDAKLFK